MYVAQSPAARVGSGNGTCRWTELQLGPVRLSRLRPPAVLPVRLGPRAWRLVLAFGGPLALRQERGTTRLRPGQLALWEPSRPCRAGTDAGGLSAWAVVVHLPGSSVPVADRALEHLAALPLPADEGPGALLAGVVETLAGQAADDVPPPQAMRLGTAVAQLCAAFLTDLVRDAPEQPSPGAALLFDIKTYIDCHLNDPGLSPARIAAAHHISVRYLHHLFRQNGLTVGGHVRAQRLERCRADLASPHLADWSVGRIRGRWGFADAAVFGRAFKAAYGLPPGEYRKRRL
ncbi:helix-turn-helix domain-containing protein [Streptomyces sp. NPDC048106]|uniref:helix-turn-helix domain-containing protein n=1 Tax=Streptomyces sp. NPDC048106 TaxID=3155750 RepID=UPI003453F713